LVKKYIEGETKEQRKIRKAKEKALKQIGASTHPQKIVEPIKEVKRPIPIPAPQPPTRTPFQNYVVCLKYGDKYNADYVNKLYAMVKRNLTIDHEFVCFTENPEGINEEIRIEPLPDHPLKGWWYKPMFFNPNLPIKGTILFFDLDVIIFDNIDYLFMHDPGKFYIIRDFNRFVIKNYQKFNSSVFRLNTGQHSEVWTNFIKNSESIMKRYQGDQDWIRVCITQNFNFWPDEWIQSYKWEMRGKPRFDNRPKGQRDFAVNGDPIIKDGTSVAVFHGDPNPHNCKDKWVIDNWQ